VGFDWLLGFWCVAWLSGFGFGVVVDVVVFWDSFGCVWVFSGVVVDCSSAK